MPETLKVSEFAAQQALAAVQDHPMHVEATAWEYCANEVFAQSKSFLDRARFSSEEKEHFRKALADVETVLLVSYIVSDKKPEPLAGFGKHYILVIHPESFAVLGAAVGTWRS